MSNEERLLTYLFRDYDPVARAVMDTSKPVVVAIDFVLLRIHGLVSTQDSRGFSSLYPPSPHRSLVRG